MKGLIVFSNNMEDSEALSTLALLRRAGLIVESATLNDDLHVKTAYGIWVHSDHNLLELDLNKYDFLIVPGGSYVSEVIDKDIEIKKTIKTFYDNKKVIAAICAAPRFLGRLGILDDRNFTAFPGSEKDALKGNYKKEQKAVVDGLIITGRSAGAVVEFSYEIVKKMKNENEALKLLTNIIY